jgi:hypothetical protein
MCNFQYTDFRYVKLTRYDVTFRTAAAMFVIIKIYVKRFLQILLVIRLHKIFYTQRFISYRRHMTR